MSYSGDAAEQVVRMSLEGAEVARQNHPVRRETGRYSSVCLLREQKKNQG